MSDPTPPPVADDKLLPCPFCGSPPERFTIDDEAEVANIGGDVIACTKCQCSTRVFFGEKVGIEEAWNTRAALRPPESSPDFTFIETTPAMRARLRELSCANGEDEYDRVVLMLLDDFAKLMAHVAPLADAYRRAKPTPSPDDAAVLDEHADALAEWKHIESEYAETSPNYVAAKARFEQARAAVLSCMSRKGVPEGWRDIASAPRDGTEVDLWTDRKERIPDAKWYTPKMGISGWRYVGLDGFDNLGWVPVEGRPTHWMPPPTPPNGDAR